MPIKHSNWADSPTNYHKRKIYFANMWLKVPPIYLRGFILSPLPLPFFHSILKPVRLIILSSRFLVDPFSLLKVVPISRGFLVFASVVFALSPRDFNRSPRKRDLFSKMNFATADWFCRPVLSLYWVNFFHPE